LNENYDFNEINLDEIKTNKDLNEFIENLIKNNKK
jgi:hypothetical protein